MSTPYKQLKEIMTEASYKRRMRAVALFDKCEYTQAMVIVDEQTAALQELRRQYDDYRKDPTGSRKSAEVSLGIEWYKLGAYDVTPLAITPTLILSAVDPDIINDESLSSILGRADWALAVDDQLREGFQRCLDDLRQAPQGDFTQFTTTYQLLLTFSAGRNVQPRGAPDYYLEELLKLAVNVNRADLCEWVVQRCNKPAFTEHASQLVEAEACAACLRFATNTPLSEFKTKFNARIATYINKYRGPEGETLLHLAVEARRGDVVLWISQYSPNKMAMNNAGIYPFGLPQAFELAEDVLSCLMFSAWRDKKFSSQVAAHVVNALGRGDGKALRFWRGRYDASDPGEDTLAMPTSRLGPIAWICQTSPEYAHLLPIYYEACGAEEFRKEYDRPENIKHLSSAEDDPNSDQRLNWKLTSVIERLKPGKWCGLRPLEAAILFGNTQAALFLVQHSSPASRADEVYAWLADKRLDISRIPNRGKYVDNNFDRTMAWHYLIATQEGRTLSAATVELACALVKPFRGLLPDHFAQLMVEAKYKAVFSYNSATYSKEVDPEAMALKNLVHRVCFTYFYQTCPNSFAYVGDHGNDGRERALQFLIKVAAARTARQIWQLTRDLLTVKPQTLLQDNSFRALLIKALFPEVVPAPEIVAATPWTEASQIAFGTLISMQKLITLDNQAKENTPALLVTYLKCAVREAITLYFDINWKAQGDKRSGFKHAFSLWQSLNNAPDAATALYLISQYLNINAGEEHSLRPCVVDSILADGKISRLIDCKADAAEANPHTHRATVARALDTYIAAQNYSWLQRASALKASLFGSTDIKDEEPAPAASKGAGKH